MSKVVVKPSRRDSSLSDRLVSALVSKFNGSLVFDRQELLGQGRASYFWTLSPDLATSVDTDQIRCCTESATGMRAHVTLRTGQAPSVCIKTEPHRGHRLRLLAWFLILLGLLLLFL